MEYYVYIIQSEKTGIYYKGYTTDPDKRLSEHNNNEGRYTAGKGPWRLVYLEKMKDKRSALIRERQLKRANIDYIQWLFTQGSNIAVKYNPEEEGKQLI